MKEPASNNQPAPRPQGGVRIAGNEAGERYAEARASFRVLKDLAGVHLEVEENPWGVLSVILDGTALNAVWAAADNHGYDHDAFAPGYLQRGTNVWDEIRAAVEQ